jgi:hypothetical protein
MPRANPSVKSSDSIELDQESELRGELFRKINHEMIRNQPRLQGHPRGAMQKEHDRPDNPRREASNSALLKA